MQQFSDMISSGRKHLPQAQEMRGCNMAEMLFKVTGGKSSDPALAADYERAERFDKVRVGDLGIYYRDGLRIRHVSYSEMQRAFIRIQEVNGRMCCGRATFSYFRLVFIIDGKENQDIMSEDEKAMDAALARIGEKAPGVPIGFVKPE